MKSFNIINFKEKINKFIQERFYFWIFIGVVFISFFLRVKYAFCERIWPDEALYAWYALKVFTQPFSIVSKEVLHFHPPLFALILSIGHWILPAKLACQWISFLFGLFGIWAVYFLGLRLENRFVGLIAAILIALNPIYLRYSNKILIDAPQMLFFILLAFTLLRLEKTSKFRDHVCVGLSCMSIVLLKWSGIVIIPIVLIYYFFALKENTFKERCFRCLIPLGMTIFATVLYWCLRGEMFHYGLSFTSSHSREPFFFYIIYMNQIVHWGLIPFILLGVFLLIKKGDKRAIYLLGSWLGVVLLSMSLVAQKTLRFSILYLPVLLIFCSIGIEGALKMLIKESRLLSYAKALVVILFVLFFLISYPQLDSELNGDNKFYKGFEAAGTWIRDRLKHETLIISSSKRIIKYHSKLHIHDDDGTIVGLPREQMDFEEIIHSNRGHILLEIDNWGKMDYTLIDPFKDDQIRYYRDKGFLLKKTFSRMRYRNKKDNTKLIAPGIWIFERE